MKKLINLKKWLTVSEAARHLSILFGEDVSEADVLRLALDGGLKLSVYFLNSALGRCGPLIPLAEAKYRESTNAIDGTLLEDNRVLEYDLKTTIVDGVWDLPMLGMERDVIEQRYQDLTGGPRVLFGFVGPIVYRDDGTYCELLRLDEMDLTRGSRNYFPSDGLPGSVLVVRTSALQEFEARHLEPECRIDKPLDPRERPTLMVIIAALAKIAKIEWTRPSKAAAAIESQAALMGVQVGVRTIEEHLKRIPGTLEWRKTN